MEKYAIKQEKKQRRSYKHLKVDEREEIAIGLEQGKSITLIASKIGRNKGTISREVRRNRSTIYNCCYRGNRAQWRSDERSRRSHVRGRLSFEVKLYVEKHLKDGWAPEEIAGRLPMDILGYKTNHESIYQWIYIERRDLIRYLPRHHNKRHKRALYRKDRTKGKIIGRVDISQRPKDIESREDAGHWEADTVVSRKSHACVAVFTERKSRKYIAILMPNKSAEAMRDATITALGTLPKGMVKTITFDNGTENALHLEIGKVLNAKTYFCKPYHSWEKGSIENRNGRLRRFYPKRTNWLLIKDKKLRRVVDKINNTPMKCLDWRTPNEVFATSVALAG